MRKLWLLLAGSLVLLAVPAFAQKITASIRGTVTDPSSAAVAGAKVTVTNEDTGLTRSVTTNSAGIYSFTELPVGSYKIAVESAGFNTAVRSKIGLNVADARSVDVQLTTGGVTETVTVEVPAVAVKTVGAGTCRHPTPRIAEHGRVGRDKSSVVDLEDGKLGNPASPV